MDDMTRRAMFTVMGGAAAAIGLAGASAAAPRVAATPIRTVEVNGARLAYRRHGTGGKRALVFGHGYALRGTGDIYQALFARLEPDFDIYALDFRGHGASAGSSAGWSQAAIADDLAGFVAGLGLRGALYAGHSLGGFTGLFAQIRHPGTFSALALLATAAAGGGVAPPGLKEAFVARGRDPGFARETFAGMYLRPGPGDVARAAAAVGLIDPGVHEAFFSNFPAVAIADRLREIRAPVLVLNGGRDAVVSPAAQHETARSLPRSKEVTFSNEGHMLPIEAADAAAREMLGFFRYDAG